LLNAKYRFSDTGYVIKPPQPSSAVYGAPPFTGHRLERVRVSNEERIEVNIHCTAL